MATNTTYEIVQSYISLLIAQYLNKPNATGFISLLASNAILPQVSTQEIGFSTTPTSGNFQLTYNGSNTTSLSWNSSAGQVQSALQALSGLSSITVAGSIASLSLIVTFTGVAAPALPLTVFSNTLFNTASVAIAITETDLTLPLAIQDAFNILIGTQTAQGVQLDTLGKYVGASRTGFGFSAYITLDDADYLTLIQMAIIKNQAGSDLATIVNFLWQFFPNEILVFDNLNMTLTYLISQTIGSQDLIQLFVTEGFLPVPMAVGVNIFYPPSAFVFSFRTATAPSTGAPFNSVNSIDLTSHWLSAHDLVIA